MSHESYIVLLFITGFVRITLVFDYCLGGTLYTLVHTYAMYVYMP